MTYKVYQKKPGRGKHKKKIPGFRARRCEAKRIYSWINRSGRLIIRLKKEIKITFRY